MMFKSKAPRIELSFSVDGLTSREDLLFRSLVRVVSQNTPQNWLYRPLAYEQLDHFKPDLLVVTEDKLPRELLIESTSSQTIVISHIERHKLGFMCLPIDPKKLESELNRQATLLTAARAGATLSESTRSAGDPYKISSTHESVRLLRWPPPGLLGSPQRIQLATLMAGQAVTLAALQKRSQQPAQACSSFIHELQKAGLLYRWVDSQTKPVSNSNKKLPVPISLLARIRSRLGLQKDSKN